MPSRPRFRPLLALSSLALSSLLVACQAPAWRQGNIQVTNRPLDLAIDGPGFFEVTQPNGQTAYTRWGAFQTDNTGHLMTMNGLPVNPPVVVPPGTTGVAIRGDGTIFATPGQGHEQQIIGTLVLTRFPNPSLLRPLDEHLFTATPFTGTPTQGQPTLDGFGIVRQGGLEVL